MAITDSQVVVVLASLLVGRLSEMSMVGGLKCFVYLVTSAEGSVWRRVMCNLLVGVVDCWCSWSDLSWFEVAREVGVWSCKLWSVRLFRLRL